MQHAYQGSPQRPYPPMERGWAVVGYGDELARRRAMELSQYRSDGSPTLPLWHYTDELLASSNGAGGGLYRLYHYSDGTQSGIGCCRFVGTQMLGQDESDGGTDDGGSDDGSSTPTTGQGLQQGQSGATDSGTGTNTDAPSSGGGGGGTTPTLPPAPSPSTPTTPTTTPAASSSSNTGLIVGIVAAVAVAATVVVAASAKGGKKARR